MSKTIKQYIEDYISRGFTLAQARPFPYLIGFDYFYDLKFKYFSYL